MAEEFEDPTSRYQNPRYSGKGVPDRANHPKRKGRYTDVDFGLNKSPKYYPGLRNSEQRFHREMDAK